MSQQKSDNVFECVAEATTVPVILQILTVILKQY